MTTNHGGERTRRVDLQAKAFAYLFVACVFALLFAVDMAVPDPVPIVDESLLLLGAALSGLKGKREWR